jgi:hypothetical protein
MKCKCGEEFEPSYRNGILISKLCYSCIVKKARKEMAVYRAKETKEMKEKLLTHKDYVKILQVLVNRYIRKRDKNKPCISCNKPLGSKFDAGHYFPTTVPSLRFDEDNIHGQCVFCNQHQHGNISNYRLGLIDRFGIEFVEKLEARRNIEKKYSISELKELIVIYKEKSK